MSENCARVSDRNLFKILGVAYILSADKLCNYRYILHVSVVIFPKENYTMLLGGSKHC